MHRYVVIKYIDNMKKDVFSGLQIKNYGTIEDVIEKILKINNSIIYYPINLLPPEERISLRENLAINRKLEQSELKFAKNIEEYGLIFNYLYYKMIDVYDEHTTEIHMDYIYDNYNESNKKDKYSLAENSISLLNLNNNYKEDYSINISIPEIEEYTTEDNILISIFDHEIQSEIFNGVLTNLDKI